MPSPFTSHIIGSVDGLLDIPPGFLQYFAHLPGHLAGVLLFSGRQDLAGPVKYLGALGRRNQPPAFKSVLGSGHRIIDVALVRGLKRANNVSGVSRIKVFKGLATMGGHPGPFDEVFISLCRHLVSIPFPSFKFILQDGGVIRKQCKAKWRQNPRNTKGSTVFIAFSKAED